MELLIFIIVQYTILAYSKDFTNWNSYRGQACLTLNFSRTIFVDCGKGDMTNKIMGNANMSRNFEYNTYWYNGSQSNDKYDTNTLDTDPGSLMLRMVILL